MRVIDNETSITMNKRRNFVNYARVTLHNGTVLNLNPSDFRISGNTYTDDWNDGEEFQLGSALGKTATLLLDNTDGRVEIIGSSEVVYPHGKFSDYDFYMSYFELYIHLPDAHHVQGVLRDEVFNIGTFTVTTPVSKGSTIEITGVDNMYMFDKPFDDCALDFTLGPSLLAIANRCCTDCGVAIGYVDFDNSNIQVFNKPKGITYRQAISYIAQIAGCNAIISPSGALNFKWYDMTPFTTGLDGGRFDHGIPLYITGDDADGGSFNPWDLGYVADGGDFISPLGYHNLTATSGTSISTDDIRFTGIMVSYDSVNVDGSTQTRAVHYPDTSGWDVYAMKIEGNPFIEDRTMTYEGASYLIAEIVATTVWGKIQELVFRPFTCSSIQDPTIEAGDLALVYDVKGNVYETIITNVRFTTGGMTELSCTAESPIKQNSRYVNPAARAQANAEKKQDDYNAMVAHFNELANQALGYYKITATDPSTGSTITYICDHSTVEASTNIIKITATGAFISEDGGQSWNSGFDISTATMLMNLIYVNGLNAKWIVAGSIDADRMKANVITSINGSTGSTTISGGKIATNSITTNHLQANAVTANKISVSQLSAISATLGTMSSGTIDGGIINGGKITGNSEFWMGAGNSGQDTLLNWGSTWGDSLTVIVNSNLRAGVGVAKHYNQYDQAVYMHYNNIELYDNDYNPKYAYFAYPQSDKRLKKNIKNIDKGILRKLFKKIRPVTFKYKKQKSDNHHIGLIAQELIDVLNDLGLDTSGYVKKDDKGYYMLEYDRLYRLSVSAIHDLYSITDEQQKEINDLKQRLEKLENIVSNDL